MSHMVLIQKGSASVRLRVVVPIRQQGRYIRWPGMDTDIESYVQTCVTCQRHKARTHAATVPLLPLEVPGTPWQSVSMDFITALPKTKAGKTAILVFVCRLTKMVHMCATVNECSSQNCAFLFLLCLSCMERLWS